MGPEGPKRVAVVGAGPVGLEAALYAATLGHDVRVYERGGIGGNIREWGFVRLFSPWRLNCSSLGRSLLRHQPADEEYPTGNEYVGGYLEPLSVSPPLRGRIHEGWTVRHIGRDGVGKSKLIGGPRQQHPFRLLCDTVAGERVVPADVVLDCSGTYGNPRRLGNGNLPAIGERALRPRIEYRLRDVGGADAEAFRGRRVLLAGDGFSAITALEALLELEGTRVIWVSCNAGRDPQPLIPDDPLPERARLSRLARRLAGGANPAVSFHPDTAIERLEANVTGVEVTLRAGGREEVVTVDRILAHVGFAPDRSIYRELQVQECYATFGPLRLAAELLADGSADCLTQTTRGADSLRHPEPGFFILGAKSYGLNSRFLMHLGLSQIREVFRTIDGRAELDLYAAEAGCAGG